MNVLLVLLIVVAIYGGYAIFDPRVVREERRRTVVLIWLAASAAVVVWVVASVGPTLEVTDPTSDDFLGLALIFVPYGAVMTMLLEDVRVVDITTPALLVTHGIALGSITSGDLDWLFVAALAMTPLVLYAALRRRVGGTVRVLTYGWCMLVFAAYTFQFLHDAIVQGGGISTTLLVLPFLLVRLLSYVTMLILFFPDRTDPIGSYTEDFGMMLRHSEIKELELAFALLLPAAAAGLMIAGTSLGEPATAFAALLVGGQLLGRLMQPPEYRGRLWWQRA
jgi:hypothetical protein